MRKIGLIAIFALTTLALTGGFASAAAPGAAFLDEHCIECHDADAKKGGLDLEALPFDPAEASSFEAWRKVFERVRDGEMPPAKKPRPAKEATEAFLTNLEEPLTRADAADIASNGRTRGRRLTRTEYEHTLHDLLGIDIPLAILLPEDSASHGFETVAAVQQLSDHQLACYLEAADAALTEAFTRAAKGDESYQRHCSPEELSKPYGGNYRGPEFRDGRSLSWPISLQFFGQMKATQVPKDGWYRITLRDVQAINPGKDGAVWGTLRSGACSSNAPMLYLVGLVEATSTPRDLTFEAWIQEDHRLELKPNDGTLKRAPNGAEGGNVSFKGRNLAKDGFQGIAHRGIDLERIYPNAGRTTVRRHLFDESDWKKADAAMLDRLIDRFANRAFRRPASNEETAAYRELGRAALAGGASFPDALRTAYRAILCSPRFLTLIEAPGRLDDHAIASRLSYALWVSMPDDALRKLADEGKLHQPEVMAQQVERLLSHAKSKRFIESFTGQWLKLNQIDFTTPDSRQFPSFDPVLQESMIQETRAYVGELIEDNLGIKRLIDSDFAFLNGRLARHYNLDLDPALKPGGGIQRVKLGEKSPRGGLVTQGAILKVTADGTHTSPMIRGVFINERILGDPVPPPPPGVPAIEPDIRGATSIRDQLDKHRSNESCVVCHLTIDPPGFALESFDPVGNWRKWYGKEGKSAKVNPSGATPDGATFEDIEDWKEIYTQRSPQLAHGVVSQFLTYATGAHPRFSDDEALQRIVTKCGEAKHGVRSLLREAILSDIFLTK